MSFTFPNPLETTEFTAPNGITYSWDNEDAKWRVKAYLPPKGPTVDLSPTPPLKPGGPSDGDLWFNTSPDDPTLYIYSEDTGTWIPAVSVSALEERVAENEALQIEIVQRLQANEVLTNFHSGEITSIKGDIIELEEEINTLAPTVERGKWTFNIAGTVANKGQFTLYDGTVGNGNPTKVFQDAQSIWLNQLDIDGTVHGFASVRPGDLIEIFVEGSPEYGLYSVYGAPQDNTSGPSAYWAFGLSFIRTLSDNAELSNGSICRFKIFNPPSGGEASEYILKGGDKVEGELRWNPYKPAADGNPAQNSFSGINVYARAGGTKHLLYVNTGGTYSPEELSTDVAPTVGKSITNKQYVDETSTAAVEPLISGMHQAILGATNFEDLKSRLLTKLEAVAKKCLATQRIVRTTNMFTQGNTTRGGE